MVLNALAWSDEGDTTQTLDAGLSVVLASVVLMPASFVAASALATGARLRSRSALGAYLIGVLVFIPFPFLATIFILPGIAWLALFGLAVPAALVEGLGLRRSLARGVQLARVDIVHVLGGLATLALLVFLTQAGLFFVLREYAESTQRTAAALASLVVSPLLFLGGALLYVDQKARLGSRDDPRKERDADLLDADETDGKGSPDTPRESRPPA